MCRFVAASFLNVLANSWNVTINLRFRPRDEAFILRWTKNYWLNTALVENFDNWRWFLTFHGPQFLLDQLMAKFTFQCFFGAILTCCKVRICFLLFGSFSRPALLTTFGLHSMGNLAWLIRGVNTFGDSPGSLTASAVDLAEVLVLWRGVTIVTHWMIGVGRMIW